MTPEQLRALIEPGEQLDVEQFAQTHGSISRKETAELCRIIDPQACHILQCFVKKGYHKSWKDGKGRAL